MKVTVADSCPLPTETFVPCSGGGCRVSGASRNCSSLSENPYRINTDVFSFVTADVDECRVTCLKYFRNCAAYRYVARPDRYLELLLQKNPEKNLLCPNWTF